MQNPRLLKSDNPLPTKDLEIFDFEDLRIDTKFCHPYGLTHWYMLTSSATIFLIEETSAVRILTFTKCTLWGIK